MARRKLKLWLLRPVDWSKNERGRYDTDLDEWNVWDRYYGFVIQAYTEDEARGFAAREASSEGAEVWINSAKTSCVELKPGTEAGIVISEGSFT